MTSFYVQVQNAPSVPKQTEAAKRETEEFRSIGVVSVNQREIGAVDSRTAVSMSAHLNRRQVLSPLFARTVQRKSWRRGRRGFQAG